MYRRIKSILGAAALCLAAQPAMGGFGFTHAAVEHAALRNDCGDVTYVSYARPIQRAVDGGAKDFYETRLLRIELK